MIDPLAMPIGADTSLVIKTLQTIQLIHDEFGLNMTLGASQRVVRHARARTRWARRSCRWRCAAGSPARSWTCASPQIVEAVKAADLLLGNDEWGWRGSPGPARPPQRRRRPRRRPDSLRDDRAGPGPGPDPLRPGRGQAPRGAGARRGHAVRRRQLERHRRRLHLRRARHLPQVQDAGARGRGAGVAAGPARVQPRRAARGLAAGLPRAGRAGPAGGGAAAGHPAQGGHRRRRAAGDPAPGRAEAVRGAVGADAVRPAHRRRAAARRAGRPGAAGRPGRGAQPVAGDARGRDAQGHRGGRRRRADRRRARATPAGAGSASRSTWAPPRSWPRCSTWPPAPPSRWRRCSTRSSPTAPT